jgi:hypothetical protein
MASAATLAKAGLAIMAASEVPNFLAGLLPSTMTIGRFAAEPADRARLRRSEIVGSALAIGVGAGTSLVAQDPSPMIMVLAVLAVLLYEYERAIRMAQTEGTATPINQQQNGGGRYQRHA